MAKMIKPKLPETKLYAVLVALGLIGTWVPLFDVDEGAFLQASREMLAAKQWLVTTLDG